MCVGNINELMGLIFSSSHIVFRIVIGVVPVNFLVQENVNEEWGVINTLYT